MSTEAGINRTSWPLAVTSPTTMIYKQRWLWNGVTTRILKSEGERNWKGGNHQRAITTNPYIKQPTTCSTPCCICNKGEISKQRYQLWHKTPREHKRTCLYTVQIHQQIIPVCEDVTNLHWRRRFWLVGTCTMQIACAVLSIIVKVILYHYNCMARDTVLVNILNASWCEVQIWLA